MKRFPIPLKARRTAAVIAVLMLISCLSGVIASAADVGYAADIPDITLTEGVYRIRNYGSGLYLDAYKAAAKTGDRGKAYLARLNADDEGQRFYLVPAESGTYLLKPQNESGAYALCWNGGVAAGSPVNKTNADADALFTRFDVIKLPNGAFTIAPAGGDNARAVLGTGGAESISLFGDPSVTVVDYVNGNAAQMWILEPVLTEQLTVAYTRTKVKLYSTGMFYARQFPYNHVPGGLEWRSSDENVIMIGDDGAYSALGTGSADITAICGTASATFNVTVTAEDAFTWYSQNNMFTSDWDAAWLNGLFFSSGGYRMRYAVDANARPFYSSWIDEGCALCSVAMVLHNLGATYSAGYDLRSGQEGNLPADPYTVSLANSGNVGARSVSDILYGPPTSIYWTTVARRFSVDGEAVAFKKIYNPSRMTIKKLLDAHPAGLIVQLASGAKTHYVIFAKCLNPEETVSAKLEFLVYDSAAYLPENGDGVMFQNTTAYTYEKYRYTSILSVMLYDTESNIDK